MADGWGNTPGIAATVRELKLEKYRRLKLAQYRADPLIWLEERMGEDPRSFEWSRHGGEYEGHEWDGDKDPLAAAWRMAASGRWVGIESATGTGKTYWASRMVFWFLDVYRDALVVTSAPKEAQLKLHLWAEIGKEFHKFKALHPNAYLNSLNLRVDGGSHAAGEQSLEQSWQAVGFVAGTGADEESATKARGFHRENMLILVEESSGMSDPVVTAFKNTSVGGNNIVVMIGNPNNSTDPLHMFCTSGVAVPYRISAYDFPNVVLGTEIVPGAVTRNSINLRRIDYGEGSPLYEAMVRGKSPEQSANSLIQVAWFDQCVELDLIHDGSHNAAGVDVANSANGDKAAVAFGRANNLLDLLDFQCPNASHLAWNLVYTPEQRHDLRKEMARQRAKAMGVRQEDLPQHAWPEEINSYPIPVLMDYEITPERVGVDAVGVGASTIQQLHNMGFRAVSLMGGSWEEAILVDDEGRPLYAFSSLRAQMYWQLREDLRQKRVSIRIDDVKVRNRLRRELAIPRYEFKANAISLEPKEAIKKRMGGESPNLADAVVYWNWVRHDFRGNIGNAMPVVGGGY